MKEYKPGDTINVNGIDLLILDETKDTVFVLAYNLDIKTEFDDKSNKYLGSELQKKTEQWLTTTDFDPIIREVKLNTVDDSSVYSTFLTQIAPLTFDEYRKYSSIIKPCIKDWFWLANKWNKEDACLVCYVDDDGRPYYSIYSSMYGSLMPAFILSKANLENPLSNFSTKELLDEISRRNLL